ncbi:hypothetical protein EH240_29125 [Mesorhizobium tamadayense]|uniref:Uncharacterized protein n=1 Tax=Mesorhizobium tamadayense TaxID=425306 RepID=A0A3P3F4T9_9HYPH|nr:hypothetical protein [Mesorhizobium tamadayense]RRH93659.1 hypothetical protein EH240_29125 [Mesorhizobium tamadayense]
MEIIKNHDAETRFKSLQTFDDIVTCEIMRHGIFSDGSELPSLTRLYNEFFLPAPTSRRKEVFEHVKVIVTGLGGWTAAAFTPFMILDDDIGIVSTATIDYVSLAPLIDGDPMSRPKDVVTMITKAIPRNPAALFGGLLALGDPRVCLLIMPLRHGFDANDAEIVSNCHSGFTTKSAVEFYLDWLRELIDRQDDEGLSVFGHVAAGLYRLAAVHRATPFINDGLRPFPVPSDEITGGWSSMTRIEPEEFASSISGRLYDLERRERAPKVMPHVIRAFGLKPRTPPTDTSHTH